MDFEAWLVLIGGLPFLVLLWSALRRAGLLTSNRAGSSDDLFCPACHERFRTDEELNDHVVQHFKEGQTVTFTP